MQRGSEAPEPRLGAKSALPRRTCLGGTRHPGRALSHLTNAHSFRDLLRPILEPYFKSHPAFE
eukprot:10244593-Alexandrium_andersonii.AAC.1